MPSMTPHGLRHVLSAPSSVWHEGGGRGGCSPLSFSVPRMERDVTGPRGRRRRKRLGPARHSPTLFFRSRAAHLTTKEPGGASSGHWVDAHSILRSGMSPLLRWPSLAADPRPRRPKGPSAGGLAGCRDLSCPRRVLSGAACAPQSAPVRTASFGFQCLATNMGVSQRAQMSARLHGGAKSRARSKRQRPGRVVAAADNDTRRLHRAGSRRTSSSKRANVPRPLEVAYSVSQRGRYGSRRLWPLRGGIMRGADGANSPPASLSQRPPLALTSLSSRPPLVSVSLVCNVRPLNTPHAQEAYVPPPLLARLARSSSPSPSPIPIGPTSPKPAGSLFRPVADSIMAFYRSFASSGVSRSLFSSRLIPRPPHHRTCRSLAAPLAVAPVALQARRFLSSISSLVRSLLLAPSLSHFPREPALTDMHAPVSSQPGPLRESPRSFVSTLSMSSRRASSSRRARLSA